MNPVLADIVGLIGSAMMVVAYAYSNMARAIDFRFFNMLNLVGSFMLIASLTVHFNIASMSLEIVWAVIAALGLWKAMRAPAQ